MKPTSRETLLRAIERSRAQADHQGGSAGVQMLGWAAAGTVTLGLHAALFLAFARAVDRASAPLDVPGVVTIDLSPAHLPEQGADDPAPDRTPDAEAEPSRPAPPEERSAPVPAPAAEAPPPRIEPALAPPQPAPDKRVAGTLAKPSRTASPKPPIRKGGPGSDTAAPGRSAPPPMASQASLTMWQSEMRARIVRAKRFPPGATGATGISLVSVTFSAAGDVVDARLIASSGNTTLDGEAVAVMRRAAPYPPPPGGRPITQAIPLNFTRR